MLFLKTRIFNRPWILPAFAGYIAGALFPFIPLVSFILYGDASTDNHNPLASPGEISAVFGLTGFWVGVLLLRFAGWTGRRMRVATFVATWIATLSLVSVGFLGIAVAYSGYLQMPLLDSVMAVKLRMHQSALNQLRLMSNADAKSLAARKVTSVDGISTEDGLSLRRREEYKRLLGEAEVNEIGFSNPAGVEFEAWRDYGTSSEDQASKGFIYLTSEPSPLEAGLDSDPWTKIRFGVKSGSSFRFGLKYRHVYGNWYLYDDDLGGAEFKSQNDAS